MVGRMVELRKVWCCGECHREYTCKEHADECCSELQEALEAAGELSETNDLLETRCRALTGQNDALRARVAVLETERGWGLDAVFDILAHLHDYAEVGEAWELWQQIPGPLGVLLACVECGLVKQSRETDCEEWYRITSGGETWLRKQRELVRLIKAQYGEEGEKDE
jgi:hypothetical protein